MKHIYETLAEPKQGELERKAIKIRKRLVI
jgi:hypothetical protein